MRGALGVLLLAAAAALSEAPCPQGASRKPCARGNASHAAAARALAAPAGARRRNGTRGGNVGAFNGTGAAVSVIVGGRARPAARQRRRLAAAAEPVYASIGRYQLKPGCFWRAGFRLVGGGWSVRDWLNAIGTPEFIQGFYALSSAYPKTVGEIVTMRFRVDDIKTMMKEQDQDVEKLFEQLKTVEAAIAELNTWVKGTATTSHVDAEDRVRTAALGLLRAPP